MNPAKLLSYILILIISLSCFMGQQTLMAQKYKKKESPNIRIDPDWVTSNRAYGFVWAYDVVADNQGNTYATGYFKNGLHVQGQEVISPKCKGRSSCGDIFFLMKILIL